MSSTEYLDAAELKALTGFTPTAKQNEWLDDNGIPHKQDGKRIIVSRLHVRAWLEGAPIKESNEPDLSVYRRAQAH